MAQTAWPPRDFVMPQGAPLAPIVSLTSGRRCGMFSWRATTTIIALLLSVMNWLLKMNSLISISNLRSADVERAAAPHLAPASIVVIIKETRP